MRKATYIAITVASLLFHAPSGRASPRPRASTAPCDDVLTRRIPERPSQAPAGDEFVRRISGMSDDEREAAILEQLLAGNIPDFLRRLRPVRLNDRNAAKSADMTVCVFPDYLAVGSDESYFLVPMRLQTAITVARRFEFALPTTRIVDAIYAQAPMHLQPQPLPAGDTMRTTAYYWQHNELVTGQRVSLTSELGFLTAGDKKDLVLTNRLWRNPGRVAIYGWHRLDGSPIQHLSTVHGARYADYSHGVRLVSDTVYVDGKARSLLTLLNDPRAARVLSDEGEIRHAADPLGAVSAR